MPVQTLFKSRMLGAALVSLVLMLAALFVQLSWPGSVVAVTLYKCHLMALGGWGGYWLDRMLSPYDRPHQHLQEDQEALAAATPGPDEDGAVLGLTAFGNPLLAQAQLRRAIIVAACLICAGLGA